MLKNFPSIDAIVRHEGEATFRKLVSKGLKNTKGISYRLGKRVIRNPDRGFIDKLDALPFPDWFSFDLKRYKKQGETGFRMRKQLSAPMITSRGCPYRCTFCYRSFWGDNYRTRSAENIVDEMEMLRERFGVRYIRFFDDNFTFSKKRTTEICKEIIRRKLDIPWRCEGRVNEVNRESYEWLKKADCHLIELGVESGSQKILNNLKKGISVKQIKNAFKVARQVGIKTKAFIIIGNPGETTSTLDETLKLLKEIKPDYIVPQLLEVMPNTELYEDMKGKSSIDDNIWLDKDVMFPYYTVEHSEEGLKRLFSYFHLRLMLQRKEFTKMAREALRKLSK
jgi:radical SAM superfamily enzyme YgiQ (UPF0313 family)